jgi:hypothetical protein
MARTVEEQVKDIAEKVPQLVDKLPDLISGIAKGNTADLLGLPVDLINETLGVVGLKQHNPTAGSEYFRKLFFGEGAQKDKNIVETVGSMISAGGAVSAGKAMIVGAIPKLIKEGYNTRTIQNVFDKVDAAELASLHGEALDLFKRTGVFKSTSDLAHKSFISDAESKIIAPVAELGGVLRENMTVGPSSYVLGASRVPVTDVLKHDTLFELYPHLKNYTVAGDVNINLGGAKVQGTTITVGPQKSKEEIRSALLHELQHGVQNLEGFSPGGTVKAQATKGVFSPELEQKLLKARAEGNKNAQGMIDALNEKRTAALKAYERLPGEVEARFTQDTKDLSGPQLKIKIADLLESQIPQNFWSK